MKSVLLVQMNRVCAHLGNLFLSSVMRRRFVGHPEEAPGVAPVMRAIATGFPDVEGPTPDWTAD